MKKFLRKWLDVPEVPEVPKPVDMSLYVKKDDIEDAVEDAIYEAAQPDVLLSDRYRVGRRNIRGAFEQRIKDFVNRDSLLLMKNHMRAVIGPESFIDEVVERIKRKQL